MASDTENQLAATGQDILEDGHLIYFPDSSHQPPNFPDSPVYPSQFNKKISFLSDAFKVLIYLVIFLFVIVSYPLFFTVVSAFFVFLLVFLPLCWMVTLSLPKKTLKRLRKRDGDGDDDPRQRGVGGMYNQAICKEKLWDRIVLSSSGMIARVSLVMLVGLVLSIFVPTLKRVTLLGSPLWKWSLLSATLTAGYFEVYNVACVFEVLCKHKWGQENIVTQYFSGFSFQIIHVMYMGMALVSWLVYFRTEQGLKQASNPDTRAFEYVTWTFVSLLVGSILFLLKGLLLAIWSADAIYRRFEPRILITSVKYFFISLAAAGFCQGGILRELNVLNQYGTDNPDMDSRKLSVTKYIMSTRTRLRHLKYVSHILESLAEITSPILDRDDEEEEEEQVLKWFNNKIKATTYQCTPTSLVELFNSRTEEHAETTNHSPSTTNAAAEATHTSSGPNGAEPFSQEDGEPTDISFDPNGTEPSSQGDSEPANASSGPNGAERSSQADGEPVDASSGPNGAEPSSQADGEPADASSGPNRAKPSSQADSERADLLFKQIISLLYWASMKRWIPSPPQSERLHEDYPAMANVLHRLVREEGSSVASDLTLGDLKMWMVDAHKDCINMGRTLADASAIVSRVDLLMSCLIILIVVLLWLLITGFASTTILVTIATPLLALTFIFGDTAKTFFQGLIFCFATHPFDVGDRCILDDTELEVKRVNILTTTFTKIGSKEKRLYPNAVLATKPIHNLGWQPDSKDVVELTLKPSTDLEKLKEKITEFFKDEKNCSKYKNSCKMMIKELGESVKVTVHFSHILTVHDLSHNQCLEKKSLQRFDLLNMIKNHINNMSETDAMHSLDPSRSSQSITSEIQDMGNMETKTQSV